MIKEIIKIEKLNKNYLSKNIKIEALKNININFEIGKLYCIKGHSGSGKSTLINILGLNLNFDTGKLFIEQNNVFNLSNDEKQELKAKKIGFIFQDFQLIPSLTAVENVILPMVINKEIDKKNRKQIAIELLKKLNLDNRVNHYPKELSGGEQQRVAIARSLANNPKIILADEPTGNLDKKNEKMIFEFLKELSKDGKCVIIVSHSDEIDRYADKIYYLNNGFLGE